MIHAPAPFVSSAVQNLVQGELSESAFPYVVPPPEGSSKRGSKPAESKSVVVSLRKKGPSNWSQKKAAGKVHRASALSEISTTIAHSYYSVTRQRAGWRWL